MCLRQFSLMLFSNLRNTPTDTKISNRKKYGRRAKVLSFLASLMGTTIGAGLERAGEYVCYGTDPAKPLTTD